MVFRIDSFTKTAFSVIEVTEDVIPSAWRQVMMVDRRKMEAASSAQPIRLSTVYQTLRK